MIGDEITNDLYVPVQIHYLISTGADFQRQKRNPLALAAWGFQPKPYHNAGRLPALSCKISHKLRKHQY